MKTKRLMSAPQTLQSLLAKLPNPLETTNRVFDLSNEKEYCLHAHIIKRIGDLIMIKEFRNFEVDRHNQKILRFLLLYFNQDKQSEEVFPEEEYKIHKPIMLSGNGGKTLLMQIFAQYLRMTGNPNAFFNVSITEMTNYFKINNHLDKYTFNELTSGKKFSGNPVNLCLNDLGLKKHMHFDVDTKVLTDDFLYARYELFVNHGKKTHLTTSLDVTELKNVFENQLTNCFKSHNIINVGGESRRK
jgi:hypothetical protein